MMSAKIKLQYESSQMKLHLGLSGSNSGLRTEIKDDHIFAIQF